ncbi:DUF5134 domain-containing protein [Streptomyces polyrhachis]|uniref:DUF5134 domain-containing protein n=1 Tax=Streptomyces polyrhachis TaxID=1282885 RepID=A0ABW2GBV1_9ACTN
MDTPMPAPPAAAMFLQLALLGLFWGVFALRLLRLIAVPLLSDTHPAADAAHAGMAGGMVYLLFPGAPSEGHRPLAVVFGAVALGFAVALVLRARDRTDFRVHDVVLLVGMAAMTLMLAADTGFGPLPALVTAVCLAATAWPLLRPVLDPPGPGRHRRGPGFAGPPLARPQRRLLITAPQVGSVAMTLGMTWMLLAS